ncbi:hypothetical protein FDECE_7621 [Fusarium decemcellulare]|nr:hypothetical protein FDECE_7621 [Fusarium decemcellulare]
MVATASGKRASIIVEPDYGRLEQCQPAALSDASIEITSSRPLFPVTNLSTDSPGSKAFPATPRQVRSVVEEAKSAVLVQVDSLPMFNSGQMSDIEGTLQSLNDEVARLPTGEGVERMMSEAMDDFGKTHIQKYNDLVSTLETTMIRREQRAEERLRQAYEQADRPRKETHSARIAFKDQEVQSIREALAQKSNEILVSKDSSLTKSALIVELTQFQVSKNERITELTSLDQTQSETIRLLQNGDEELRSAVSSRDIVIQNLQASNTQAKDEADLAASLANERA